MGEQLVLNSNNILGQRPLGDTVHETLRWFWLGLSVDQIAKQRGLVTSTIYGHLEQAIQAGEPIDLNQL